MTGALDGGRPVIEVSQLAHARDLPIPSYESDGAAGMDLRAAVPSGDGMVIPPGSRALVPTGLVMALPDGFEAQVRPRSGLALKHGLTVLNAPGTIDSDYRGEVGVILINHGEKAFTIQRGDRIAQIVVAPVSQAHVVGVREVNTTRRGGSGFGSTGV